MNSGTIHWALVFSFLKFKCRLLISSHLGFLGRTVPTFPGCLPKILPFFLLLSVEIWAARLLVFNFSVTILGSCFLCLMFRCRVFQTWVDIFGWWKFFCRKGWVSVVCPKCCQLSVGHLESRRVLRFWVDGWVHVGLFVDWDMFFRKGSPHE